MSNKKICPNCKDIELTDQESTMPTPRCYFCQVEITKQTLKALGIPDKDFKPPNPEDFGRAKDVLTRPKPSVTEPSSVVTDTSVSTPDDKAGFINDPNLPAFSPEAKKLLKKEFDFDIDNPPPITIIEARGQEGTVLRFEITAKMRPEWVKALQEILNKDLEQIIRLITFGTKHKTVLDDVTQYLNKQNESGPSFPFMD